MAGTAFDLLGAAEPYMKRVYDERALYSMAYDNRPLYAWVPKRTGILGGSPFGNANGGYQVPITIDDIAGESADFKTAAEDRDGMTGEVWQLNRVKRYGTSTMDGETIDSMGTNVGAFIQATRPLISSAINQVSNSMAYFFYGDGTGARGEVASKAGNALTLTAASSHQARALGLKRTIVSSSTASGGSLDGESTGTKVTAIDFLPNGQSVVTVADATNISVGDYLFIRGDYTASGANQVAPEGLGSWGPDPTTITAGNPFKGVDRATYKSKLLMLHATIANQTTPGDGSFVRGIREAAATLGANEGKPDALFVSYQRWAQIESDLASQSRYEMMMGSDGVTGFDSIVINCGGRRVKCVADPWCPPNTGYLLQRDTWEMYSTKQFPTFLGRDGNTFHRLELEDSIEFRLGGYANFACKAPGHNMVLNFATA